MSTTTALAAVDLLIQLIERTSAAAALIRQARAEGREVSSAELAGIKAQGDALMADLDAAIERAKAEGR